MGHMARVQKNQTGFRLKDNQEDTGEIMRRLSSPLAQTARPDDDGRRRRRRGQEEKAAGSELSSQRSNKQEQNRLGNQMCGGGNKKTTSTATSFIIYTETAIHALLDSRRRWLEPPAVLTLFSCFGSQLSGGGGGGAGSVGALHLQASSVHA
ncbi:unnamed protein product [Pleuronectes platessa]|uniref:Uncharacterized protein n=1 Tax=Pleuronectes platessa TaxID=8262 RepID=A0A9N7UAV1_PLEPL|nr:unnamed protein product [Pleuronectes platessa]